MWTCRNCPLAVSLLTIPSVFIVERDILVDRALVNSNIWKNRYQPNVQLRMLYLINEIGPLKLVKRPSYLSLNATFSSFSIPPPHLEPEMEMTQVELFCPVRFSWLLDGWSISCAQPEDTQFKTLAVIHERYTHTDTQTEPTVAIRRFIYEWICVKIPFVNYCNLFWAYPQAARTITNVNHTTAGRMKLPG
jgi:hypothetical protein